MNSRLLGTGDVQIQYETVDIMYFTHRIYEDLVIDWLDTL